MRLHAVHVNFFLAPPQREPEDLLQAWPALVDIAEAPTTAGVRVSVVQASARRSLHHHNGIDYHFEPAAIRPYQPSDAAILDTLLQRLQGDVLHVHGLGFSRQARALADLAPATPILLQDHADRLPRLWRRAAWRRGVAAAAGIAFCAEAQAKPFRRAALIDASVPIFGIPESTSRFSPGDRDAARRATGLCGDPGLLWVGHLDANKDPLTMLDGVARAARSLPELRLWCCYGSAPLLTQVQALIDSTPTLRGRVHLLGSVGHDRIQQLMRAADLFVAASHREGSGFALIEALACGLPPVVTDIPSFRALTGDGAVGRLWQCGDAGQLASELLAASRQISLPHRQAIRQHFDRQLSLSALGRRLGHAYRQLAAGRGTRVA